jgi:Cd2+/Zn2+-exporting ATPase
MGAAGSDVAIETADIALMSNDLGKVADAIRISRSTLRNMRQNLVIALLTVGGLLAGVLSGHIHMAGGMLVHQLSVLAVVANGMRLLRR